MSYVLVQNGLVAEVFSDEPPIAERFHPDFVASLISVSGEPPAPGMTATEGPEGWTFAPPSAPPATNENVDAERDRRTSGGFHFAGKLYQSRPEDRENIAGAATAALAAKINGAQPGNLRWADPDTDFAWIAEDNDLVPMDAQTAFAFAQAAMAHKQRLIFQARTLKDTNPIPSDYANDTYWPES